MKKILFVCLGNICRSSSAEEIMRTYIRKAGLEQELEVDSAGILSYHQGELPDERMRAHALRRGYNLTHRSRPVRTSDFFGTENPSDDRFLPDEHGRLCAGPLLWRSARFRACSGYPGRCLRWSVGNSADRVIRIDVLSPFEKISCLQAETV